MTETWDFFPTQIHQQDEAQHNVSRLSGGVIKELHQPPDGQRRGEQEQKGREHEERLPQR